jgi:hypothetical protein
MGTKRIVGGVEGTVRQYGSRAARWVNQCAACQKKGYKPEMPNELTRGGTIIRDLRKYLEPLPLDDAGLCELCSTKL